MLACPVKPEVFTVSALLNDAAQRIVDALGLDTRTARLEARVLAGHVLNVTHSWLIAYDNDVLDTEAVVDFRALLARRLSGEPIAYLTGVREFYGYSFKVTPDVLIPRPETELLVECALAHISQGATHEVLELGCGSGCVAIALALKSPLIHITAVDNSPAALMIAQRNAQRLNAHIEFIHSDWYKELTGRRFDLIVSNPPYVAMHDPHLAQGDLRFEPAEALSSGVAGLDALRLIIVNASHHLRPSGSLILEHGYDQAEQVQALLKQAEMTSIQSSHDLAGVARVTSGILSR